jgi:hypothetical protein
MNIKLSSAQQIALKAVCDTPSYTCIDRYAPAKKLVELGLATSKPLSFGRIQLTSTAAGRELRSQLAEESRQKFVKS